MKYNDRKTFTNTINLEICFLQDAGIPYNAVTELKEAKIPGTQNLRNL